MKIFPIKQQDVSACGPTSIQMVVDYFRLPISRDRISHVSDYKKKDGMGNIDLVNTLKGLGLGVLERSNSKWEDLANFNRPDKCIIVSWMLLGYIGHFSVVERVNKDFIELADPVSGKIIKMKKIMFMRLWLDYDDMWYPLKNSDIQLRWMCVVEKN